MIETLAAVAATQPETWIILAGIWLLGPDGVLTILTGITVSLWLMMIYVRKYPAKSLMSPSDVP